MITGNAAYDGGYLFFTTDEYRDLVRRYPAASAWFRRVAGTSEFNDGKVRWCLWIEDADLDNAKSIPEIADRIEGVLNYRRGGGEVAQTLVGRPHQFRYRHLADRHLILVPQVSAEDRPFLPVGFLDSRIVITHLAHVLYDGGLPSFALLSSKLHQIWVHTLAGRLGNGVRYSSNLCWNTFPVPTLTEKNKADLTRCAEDILLAREAHFPATIADLYDPDAMPDDLRAAHERNDEVLERIYIGRRFRNDTERLEKLFELYTRVTAGQGATKKQKAKATA
ncbi:type IIL restriction-modification enzyme MmeI [Roseomonas mucosa]|uniref:type IIL restriction-modification enzyme MmeI n=1 Tax=Roseomonas mucosa TaxID=207340 RepID=UPI003979B54B